MKSERPSRQAGKGATDLGAGIAATVVFLLTASLLGIGWLPFSVVVSVLVYIGVRLLLPAATAVEPPTVSPNREALIQELAEMDRRLPPAIAQRLARIVKQGEALMAYFKAHPERSDPGLSLTGQYLQMAYDVVRRWLTASQATPHLTPQATQKLEEFLSDVSQRLSQLHQGMLQADDAHLAGEIEALTRTMKEMDEVYQRIGGGTP